MAVSTAVDKAGSKVALYQAICEELDQLLGTETNFIANAANTSALLIKRLPDVNWAGFYISDGKKLVLGPFQGNPACARIPFGKGVCGKAAAKGQTVIVPDVSKFPGYIVCDVEARSEIVVPLVNWGKVLGVIDVDSATLGRFDEDDQEGLESVAAVFLASQLTHDLPELSDERAT